tara:strand:+ start:2291 stop:2509 length:219 start_codon:yes stop_codon:yes gene_type:complete
MNNLTIYLYKNYGHGQALAILGSNVSSYNKLKEAKQLARKLDCVITGRDCLGGLRFEINLNAPKQHQVKTTK